MRTEHPIDFVIPWVDPTDPQWQSERALYSGAEKIQSVIDNSEARFRDWDTLKYLFRSIDLFAPWVRTVHFVTCGHLPHWMNPKAERLHIVWHEDFMDPRYLPTFSSHAIELNLHKIKDLSEHFVYFNDDIVLLRPVLRNDFFSQELPRDYAIMSPAISSHRFSVMDTALTDIEIINDHFRKNHVISRHPFKWFNLRYGSQMLKSLLLMPWPKFANLYGRHLCNAFLRSTFEEVWQKEYAILDSTCLHKFRTRRDVNQWLMRDWQLASGRFIPTSPNHGRYYALGNDNRAVIQTISAQRYNVVCLNDNGTHPIDDFEKEKMMLTEALEQIFREKSAFEQ